MSNFTANFTANFTSPQLTKDLNTVEIVIMSTNVVFGFPLQSYVLWLIVTGTGSGLASEFFSLNLSVCEIVICLDCLLFVLSKCFLGFIFLALFLQGLIIVGRPLFQCLICVERYLAVVHPVTFLRCKPLRYRAICSAAAWIISLGSCVFCFISLSTVKLTMHAFFFSILFLILLFIQLFLLLAVLRALKQSGPGEKGREREEENRIKRRAFNLILLTTVNMINMYVPMIISGVLTFVFERYVSEFWIPALLSYVLGGFLQPVLYLHRCGKLSCFTSS